MKRHQVIRYVYHHITHETPRFIRQTFMKGLKLYPYLSTMKTVRNLTKVATLGLLGSANAKIFTLFPENAILPSSYEPQPAIIQIDDQSGKIVDVF